MTRPGGSGDIFLTVTGQNSGPIRGESQDQFHAQAIDVVSWSWGLNANRGLGGERSTRELRELTVVKRFDSASTPLMSALRTNEIITKAELVQRKAGGGQLEFLKITLEQARVTSLSVDGGDEQGNPEIVERVTFSFNQISVEYTPQSRSGRSQGSMLFVDQIVQH